MPARAAPSLELIVPFPTHHSRTGLDPGVQGPNLAFHYLATGRPRKLMIRSPQASTQIVLPTLSGHT